MVQQYLPGLILNTILETVREMNDPYQAKPGLGGMIAYPPKAMAVVCILMEAEMKTYRKMVGYLKMHPDVVRRIGLSKAPSKNTIWRAYGRIPESYLREVHLRIVHDITTGSLAGDSAGYSSNRFTRWFSIRHDRTETKRGWIKLHSIIDIPTRTILDYHVADGYAADITSMWPMMDRLGASGEDGNFFCLDSAYPYGYLARLLCDAIANRVWIPRILPKSNTVCKNGGSQAWGDMTRTHRDDLERFMSGLPPAQHHRGRLWGNQEDVRQPPPGQEARTAEAGGGHPGNLLQHRGGRAISRKKRQAHTRVTRGISCLTDAATPAPSMWGSLRIIL